jgi:hypothetical protein
VTVTPRFFLFHRFCSTELIDIALIKIEFRVLCVKMNEKNAGDIMKFCEKCKVNEVKVHFDTGMSSLTLCIGCYNEMMAEGLDIEMEQLPKSFSVKDFNGTNRTFHVEVRILPNGVFIDAAEDIDFGYKFAIHGELECDQRELFTQLVQKVSKALGEQQVDEKVFPNGVVYHSMIRDQIIGRIEHNENSEGNPLVIIDGRPFTWEEVGKMVMSYEGFQIKLKMADPTEDVE